MYGGMYSGLKLLKASFNSSLTQYSVEIRNQFQPLEDEYKDRSEWYQEVIAANEIATEKYVPRRVKSQKLLRSRHPAIVRARERLTEIQITATSTYDGDLTDNSQAVDEAWKPLYSTYNRHMADYLEDKSVRIEQVFPGGQCSEA